MELSEQTDWQDRLSSNCHEVRNSTFKQYFDKYLPVDDSMSCIEIGAIPPGELIYLAKFHKYRVTALDYIDDVDVLADIFDYNQVENYRLVKHDFLTWQPDRLYDVVFSNGFVEHFIDYDMVIKKHMDLK